MRRPLILALGLMALPAHAHDGAQAHYFLMTQVEILDGNLYVDVWVERPTPDVAAEFQSMFEHDPSRADEQDQAFFEFNLDRMMQAITVELSGEPLALTWTPGNLVNNGQGNEEFFTWAILAEAPVPDSLRELDLRIRNALFEAEHVFLSCYVKLDGGWKVGFDSARATLESADEEVRADRAGVSWTHDPAVRAWELRLRR
jgi:hypothetical protein